MMQKFLFIDRDGTLIEEPTDFQVDELAKIKLMPRVIPSLLALVKAGFKLIMISNQDGLGTSAFSQSSFQLCNDFILSLFRSQDIEFHEVFICPHYLEDQCNCRKPKTGLVDEFLAKNIINKDNSWVIGDRETDKELAANLGIAYLPISKNHGWKDLANAILANQRSASIKRQTKETDIEVVIKLDSEEESAINTSIGFFSHMLAQVAKHGGFYLKINAKGDLEVDEHHLD